jgi:hypothetical protein
VGLKSRRRSIPSPGLSNSRSLPARRRFGNNSTSRPRGNALWKLSVCVGLVAASVLLRGAAPAFADYDYSRDNVSNPYTGYWQYCTGDYCVTESVNYTFSGSWGTDEWNCGRVPPCRYQWFLDYESQQSFGMVWAHGDAQNGRCCPDVQVTIDPDQFVLECYHGRSSCGSKYVAYRMAYDSQRQGDGVTCPQSDFCVGWAVHNEEQQGFIDPAILTGACEVAVGQAVPNGGTCGARGYAYEFGQ